MKLFAGYGNEEWPLRQYGELVLTWNAALLMFLALIKAAGKKLPERFAPGDILLLGIATHKLARIITRDWVTSPLRAPFTEYVRSAGGGEVDEKSRGEGMQRAIGDLLTCPFCIGPWVAGALFGTFVLSPRVARLVGGIFTAVTISDFMHHSYARAKSEQTPAK